MIVVFDEVYILFHFNIIIKQNRVSSTKIIYIYLSHFFLMGILYLIYDFWNYAHFLKNETSAQNKNLVYLVYTTGKI